MGTGRRRACIEHFTDQCAHFGIAQTIPSFDRAFACHLDNFGTTRIDSGILKPVQRIEYFHKCRFKFGTTKHIRNCTHLNIRFAKGFNRISRRFKDIVEIPRGCVSYVAVDVKGSVMTAEFVLVNAVSGERVITRRFGISK